MNWNDFSELVLARLLYMGYVDPLDQAVIMACCEQESRVGSNGVSVLADEYNNLFGIKATDNDEYKHIVLPPNEFESEPQTYRWYDTIGESIANFMWHLDHSKYYRTAKMRGWELRLKESMDIWCEGNPQHTSDVLKKFRKWAERLEHDDSD